jgi:hypothetical protein
MLIPVLIAPDIEMYFPFNINHVWQLGGPCPRYLSTLTANLFFEYSLQYYDWIRRVYGLLCWCD